jgi:hypothetical protein
VIPRIRARGNQKTDSTRREGTMKNVKRKTAKEFHGQTMNSRDYILARYVDLSVEALEDLRAAAVAGSTMSKELLRCMCDTLVRGACDAHLVRKTLQGGSRKSTS